MATRLSLSDRFEADFEWGSEDECWFMICDPNKKMMVSFEFTEAEIHELIESLKLAVQLESAAGVVVTREAAS